MEATVAIREAPTPVSAARWAWRVERDLWFKPGPIDEVLRRERPSAAVREGEV